MTHRVSQRVKSYIWLALATVFVVIGADPAISVGALIISRIESLEVQR